MVKNKVGKWEFSEEKLLKELEIATERGDESLKNEPRAESVNFNARENLIIIRLINGCMFGFPPSLIKELQKATLNEIAQVKLSLLGTGLHWDNLDAHYTITGLLNGVFGTKAWMKELGRKGGSQKSEAKTEAARANGAKGGRPKKNVSDHHLNIRLNARNFLPTQERNAFQVLAAKVASSTVVPIKELEKTKFYLEEPVTQENRTIIGARILPFHKKMETNLTIKNVTVSKLEEGYASESFAA